MPSLALAKTSNKERAAKLKMLCASVGKLAINAKASGREVMDRSGKKK
jgi:hypothetical protein